MTTEILTQGLGVATVPLATYILLQNTAATNPEYINQIIGGLGIILTARAAVGTKWKEIVTRLRRKIATECASHINTEPVEVPPYVRVT